MMFTCHSALEIFPNKFISMISLWSWMPWPRTGPVISYYFANYAAPLVDDWCIYVLWTSGIQMFACIISDMLTVFDSLNSSNQKSSTPIFPNIVGPPCHLFNYIVVSRCPCTLESLPATCFGICCRTGWLGVSATGTRTRASSPSLWD